MQQPVAAALSGPESYFTRNPQGRCPPPLVRDLAARPMEIVFSRPVRCWSRFNDPGHANRVTSACGPGIYRDTLLGEEFYETPSPASRFITRSIGK
ncbi:MAG: hypothetical protein KIT22_06035 [Verrucomicrobiae bacterium]|nr:hypothetical protein [Verrucomicrobiae bacterium]